MSPQLDAVATILTTLLQEPQNGEVVVCRHEDTISLEGPHDLYEVRRDGSYAQETMSF